jgi:hypothetical protein
MKQILGILLFTLSLVSISAADGLSGAERSSFVKAGYESCMKSQTADPVNASLPVGKDRPVLQVLCQPIGRQYAAQ